MLLKRVGFVLLVISILVSCVSPAPEKETQIEPPEQTPHDKLLHLDHKYFEIFYSPRYRLAKYVRYTLTAEQLRRRQFKRSDRFRVDEQLTRLGQPVVRTEDYRKSGYDKGHLAPAEDFAWNQDAMDETFVLSNISPQKAALNRGPWKKLEHQVRRWACGEEKITVYTGPILEPGLKTTTTGLPLPNEFFKLIIDETPPKKNAVYILKQNDKGDILAQRLTTLAELQKKLQETLLFDANEEDIRRPAQVNPWLEKDCGPKSGTH